MAGSVTGPRVVQADNPGPFTFDGTCTWLVGEREVAVIDPGPDLAAHRSRILEAVEDAVAVHVLLTHGHGDHAGGAEALAAALGVELRGFGASARPFGEGEAILTDHGRLVPMETPGHTRHHYAFHWPEHRGLFSGDLILGRGDTTWVAEYSGCVADYLDSLDLVDGLELDAVFPGHGPVVEDVAGAVARYRAHRLERVEQVRVARRARPGGSAEEIFDLVYGVEVPEGLRGAAMQSLRAIVAHLDGVRDTDL